MQSTPGKAPFLSDEKVENPLSLISQIISSGVCTGRIIFTVKFDVDVDVYKPLSNCGACATVPSLLE